MQPGYDHPLYLLPFDHRNSYIGDLFHFNIPLDAKQKSRVEDSKQVIYEGFIEAATGRLSKQAAGVLVDQEYGAAILGDARKRGYTTAVSVERSGCDEFQFEYGEHFAEHIEAVDPTFAKVLVRYNPDDDAALNLRQVTRLQVLSMYCQRSGRRLMFELLVPATDSQLHSVGGNRATYDLELRPGLMLGAIGELQEAGVEPAIWKIEGLDRREDCVRMVEVVRRDGRDQVGCIVLGRGADDSKVIAWLETAATVEGFIGFAVGRTTFHAAITDYVGGLATRHQAASRIAAQYAKWVSLFEHARDRA